MGPLWDKLYRKHLPAYFFVTMRVSGYVSVQKNLSQLYQRYVDDCSLLFKSQSHARFVFIIWIINMMILNLLVNYNRISFLDVLVNKLDSSFYTNLYGKQTFIELGMKFSSAVNFKFKIYLISCLLERTYNICFSYQSLIVNE